MFTVSSLLDRFISPYTQYINSSIPSSAHPLHSPLTPFPHSIPLFSLVLASDLSALLTRKTKLFRRLKFRAMLNKKLEDMATRVAEKSWPQRGMKELIRLVSHSARESMTFILYSLTDAAIPKMSRLRQRAERGEILSSHSYVEYLQFCAAAIWTWCPNSRQKVYT
jgi:hypothetical protein